MGQRPIHVVANRLPVGRSDDGWKISTGGLVTAMRPVVARTGGAWLGWDGGDHDIPRRVKGLSVDLHGISLSEDEVAGYYHGFANRTLWPLFHDLVRDPVIDGRLWATYRDVNVRFATALSDVAVDPDGPAPAVWVQDYHLLLLPRLIRAFHPDRPIGFFLHTPFPPPELMARLPWRKELLDGMLGADVVSFHTPLYRDNFLRSVQWVHGADAVDGHEVVLGDGRRVRALANGISIDTQEFAEIATSEETEGELAELRQQFEGKRVLLGVDRVDYTKGIRHRLQAIDALLERHPDLRDHFAFVQIAVPSREDVEEYAELRDEIELEVGRINGRFTEPGHSVPVHYLYRGVPRTKLTAYYRLADVLCVTPLKDGMNLVAKEFVICQEAGDGTGVLLLSEFTGAAIELSDGAVTCNPFDVDDLAEQMQFCLEVGPEDARQRLGRLADSIREHDVYSWLSNELQALGVEAAADDGGADDAGVVDGQADDAGADDARAVGGQADDAGVGDGVTDGGGQNGGGDGGGQNGGGDGGGTGPGDGDGPQGQQ